MIEQVRVERLTRSIARSFTLPAAFSGCCIRCMQPKYGNRLDAFSGEGSREASGRFHGKGELVIVYTSTDLKTAEWEYSNTARSSGLNITSLLPYIIIGADVTLSKVLDLSDALVRERLGVTLAEVRSVRWDASSDQTLTQIIGRLAYEAKFEAILAPSRGGGLNLNIFRQNLLPDSSIEIINEDKLPAPGVAVR